MTNRYRYCPFRKRMHMTDLIALVIPYLINTSFYCVSFLVESKIIGKELTIILHIINKLAEVDYGSLPCSKHPATGSYHAPNEFIPQHSGLLYVSEIHFNIVLPSTLMSLKLSYFPTKILYSFIISPMCITWSTHLILWFDSPNHIWWRLKDDLLRCIKG